MNRKDLVKKAYDYSEELLSKHFAESKISHIITEKFEDLYGYDVIIPGRGDITTEALFKEDRKSKAYIIAKEKGVLAGVEEIAILYERRGMKVDVYKKDGDKVEKGSKILKLEGSLKEILTYERSCLNFLQRMSGIATATNNLKDKIKNYGTEIVATRKSHEKRLDKRAVTIGGGLAHRLGLYDGILIKDTHLDILREEGIEDVIEEAIEKCSKLKVSSSVDLKFIEIEVSNYKEAIRAARKFKETVRKTIPCIIMLDNMKPTEIKKVITKLKKEKLYDDVLLEASGNINEKNIRKYAEAGVDAISIGAITHSVKALDISQKIVRREV